jgi:uncharacterized protein YndB with AHSA1/START domain
MSKPEFVYVTYIETTPEKLWEALTDGDFTERYWFGARLKSDWKVGSTFEMLRSDGAVSDAGKVVEVDRPRRLAYTFINQSDKYRNEFPALATFVLEPYGRLVKLTLTHEGFAEGSKFFNGVSKGWPAILSSLKSILETGHPLEIPFEALKFEG